MKMRWILLLVLGVFAAELSIALAPLWVWLANGHTIYGGPNHDALSFGLSFIGTFLVVTPTVFIEKDDNWF